MVQRGEKATKVFRKSLVVHVDVSANLKAFLDLRTIKKNHWEVLNLTTIYIYTTVITVSAITCIEEPPVYKDYIFFIPWKNDLFDTCMKGSCS